MALIPFTLAAVFLLFIQALMGRSSPLTPDFGPILAVYLGLFGRREWISLGAGTLGLLRAGLDLDPLAAVVVIYLFVAHAVALVRGAVFRERVATQWVVSFAAGSLFLLLHSTVALVFSSVEGGGGAGLLRVSVATLSATLIAPGVFGLLRLLRVGP